MDPNHPQAKQREVASGANGPLSTYLMLSDCGNNNNKFYVCQILKNSAGAHEMWIRYGRVGDNGQSSTVPVNTGSFEREYHKKVSSKTGKGYKAIDISFGGDDKAPKAEESKFAESKLPKPVKELMNLVFNFDLIKASAVKIGFDVQRMPLGQLSSDQVQRGIACLKQIEQLILSKKATAAQFSKLSSDFYT